MIKIAIVEDEKNTSEKLREFVLRYQKENLEKLTVEVFEDGLEILEPFSGDWNIIFMDIKLKNLDGMTTAAKIRELDEMVVIIFVTTMSSFAIKGYEVGALDFVVKPVEYSLFSLKLKKAINMAKKNTEKKFLLLPTKEGKRKLSTDEILYIEVRGHQLFFTTLTETFSMRSSMKNMEQELFGAQFVKSNHSFLVNLKNITGIEREEVMLHSHRVPISRGRKKEFLEAVAAFAMGGYQ